MIHFVFGVCVFSLWFHDDSALPFFVGTADGLRTPSFQQRGSQPASGFAQVFRWTAAASWRWWDSMGRWWWLVLACQRLLKTVSQLPVLTRSTLMFTNITNFQSLGINVCPPRLRMLGHVEMSMPSYIRSTRGTGKAAKSSVFELRLFCSSKQRIIGCIGEPVRLTVPWLSIRMRVRKVLWKGSNWLSTESLSRITKHDKHW